MLPSGVSTGPQDGFGSSPSQMLHERTTESPVSEYSTPKGSPAGRISPQGPANHTLPISPRSPFPSRPPRPDAVMPIQESQTRDQVSSRTPPKARDDLTRYGERADKPLLEAIIDQNSKNETSSEYPTSPGVRTPSFHLPLPQPQNATAPSTPPRKTQLIPPSSSRKGSSSLYSQGVYFSPIIEESPEASSKGRGSVASSKIVPSSWGSHPDDYKSSRIQEKFEEEESRKSRSPTSPGSTGSMHDDTTSLVRQASMGKKMKPSLTRIRHSSENVSNKKKEAVGLASITAGVAAGALGGSLGKPPAPAARNILANESTENRTAAMDNSPPNSRSSQDSGNGSSTLVDPMSRSRSPLAFAADGSGRQPTSPMHGVGRPSSKGPSMSDKVPSDRRPPQLDMEAVRDSEIRTSISSLPDLIRRATRLAANLDRGKMAQRKAMFDVSNEKRNGTAVNQARYQIF